MNATPSKLTPDSDPLENLIRQRAYSLWLDSGCLNGGAWDHWFAAKQQVLAESAATVGEARPGAGEGAAHLSIRHTLEAHQSDPTHRFHGAGAAHDQRLNVVAGEARQRVRGRRFDHALRSQPKKTP